MAEVAALDQVEPASPGGPEVAGRSPWALAGRRLVRNRVAMGGLVLFLLIVVVSFAAPIHHSKAMLIDPKSGEPTRIRRRKDKDGTLERIAVKSDQPIPRTR